MGVLAQFSNFNWNLFEFLLHSANSVVTPELVLTGMYYYLGISTPMLE